MKTITPKSIQQYEQHLINEEKSEATSRKYLHDIKEFFLYISCNDVTKSDVLKEHHKALYTVMFMNGSLFKHLAEIDEACHSCLKDMMSKMAEQEAETELEAAYKDSFSRDTFKESIRITDKDLHENLYAELSSIIRKLKAYKQQQKEQTYSKPKHKELDDELEL